MRKNTTVRWVLVSVGAVIAMLGVVHPAQADDILVSQSADRSGAVSLNGVEIFGEVFIFLDTGTPGSMIKDVEFFINGSFQNKDNNAPYDLVPGSLVGTAKSFDTLTEMNDGPNTAEVILNLKNGDSLSFIAAFTVNNAFAPIAPSSALQVVTATADVAALTLTLVGDHFDRGLPEQPPRVSLDLQPLVVTGSTGQFLDATLPDGLPAGDHVINVSTDGRLIAGLADDDHSEFLLTIGAVDLDCADCVSSAEVDFAFAAGDVKNGTALQALEADVANDLDCLGCVSSGEVDFNFAGSTSPGGKANDADTVDGFEGAALEESAEILSRIASHAAVSNAHHTKTTSFDLGRIVVVSKRFNTFELEGGPAFVNCPAGGKIIGGGAQCRGNFQHLVESMPFVPTQRHRGDLHDHVGEGWQGECGNAVTGSFNLNPGAVFAICVVP